MPIPWSRLEYLESLGPGGGIDANIGEMTRYALLQFGDGMPSGRRVVSAQMIAELHRPEIALGADWPAAARIQNLHYALGWFTGDVRASTSSIIPAQILVSEVRSFWHHLLKLPWSSSQTGSRTALLTQPLRPFSNNFSGSNPADGARSRRSLQRSSRPAFPEAGGQR